MHKDKGCEWTGELRELDNHLSSDSPVDKALQGCPYTVIKCPLSCAGCEKGVCRKDIKSHVNDKLLSHVMTQNALMKSFEQQLQVYHGSNARLKAQLEKSKSDKEHLKQRVVELEMKINELHLIFASKPQSYGPPQRAVTHVVGTFKPIDTEFTIESFEEHRRTNEFCFSPHFYTHPNGYKMCLRVHPNGLGSSKGTHLSVYVCLMQGEFDDQLKWPFQGSITIKLIDQEANKNHLVRTVCFTENTPKRSCMRIMMATQVGDGWGYQEMLPLTRLRPKYLKNGCIKLCIDKVIIL